MKKNCGMNGLALKKLWASKTFLSMRLTFYVLLLAVIQGFAVNSYSQVTKLNLNFENSSVREVLSQIEDQSEFYFLYNSKIIDVERKVNVNLKNKKIDQVLNILFEDTNVEYTIVDRQIVLSGERAINSKSIGSQQKQVAGKVTDESNLPLPGVTIIVKGTTQGTISDVDGNYSINIPPSAKTLVFSFIGMRSQEVEISEQTQINIQLLQDIIGIEEVVTIGYGYTRKSDLTGSVSSISAEELENIPASRVDQILQGKAAGVQVTQISGEPGSGSSIRIRGGNSIQGDNEPLYVIDGFIVGTGFNLNNINVNDIESLEILKDAASVSIYGTRGANGVILITTKSGLNRVPGKPVISVNAYSGVQQLTSEIDLANGPELAYLANLDATNRGAALPFPDINNVPNVDWIDQVTEPAPMNNLDLSISGRTQEGTLNYYVSGNYFSQDGIVRASGIEKYIFRTNLDVKPSDKLSFGVRLNITHIKSENNKVNLSNLWYEGLTAKAIYNEDGSFTSRNPITGGTMTNAEADIQMRVDHDYVTNILGTGYLQYEPIAGLILKSTIGPKINNFKRNRYLPGALPERLETLTGGQGTVNSNLGIDILNENTVTFAKQINENHKFDVLGGFTWQTYKEESSLAQAEGFTNDAVQFNSLGLGDPARNTVTSGFNSYQLVSWLGRANYNLKEKYLLTLVGRVDASSRFAGSNNEYAFFPSAAVAWRLIEEPWIKNLDVFDNLKLRSSYGKSGSQAIGSYRTLALLDPESMFFNALEQPGVRNGRPASPDLKWETTEQLDIGLESAFFRGRLSFEMDYYYKKTKDLLLNVEIPTQTGFSTKLQNLGAVQNQGLELMVNSINMKKNDFTWETTLTIAGNRSEVLDIGDSEYLNIASPTNQGGPGGRLIVGQPVPVFVGVQYLGVWDTQEEIDASGIKNQLVGGPHFHDTDGDQVISENDFEVIGSPEPLFYGGIMNSFTWKNFKLDVYFNGSYGNDLYNSMTQQSFFFREGTNSYAELMDHWTPENMDSDIPMPGTSQSLANIKSNTKLIEDGSYLRLKNLRFTYDIPTQKLKGIDWLKKLNVYFSGTNLALFAKNRLFDPEVSRYGTNSTAIGFTNGEYPLARTLTIGLRADF